MNMHIKYYNNGVAEINAINDKNTFLGKNTLVQKEFNIDMSNALSSINEPSILFTNMLKRKDEYFKFIKTKYRESKSGKLDLLVDFKIENLVFKNKKNLERFRKILEYTYNKDFSNIPPMIKCKHLINTAFQLFIVWENKNLAKVLLIDVHHLVFPTKDKSHHEENVDKQAKYNERKDYNISLSEIKS